ncbi:GNAT family N-acetyltransferase [Streptomyces griseus]|uniref:GNAT family N-acetyltransferase n=1 Tax=Streptomyces TaxID=1883 RepID=UPI0001C1965C|nr:MULTISPECIES: GNAT family N-acetyltransferase [unclassified Streptomyces]EGE43290.1 GCN5-related N-acetyltransferase [Streptomyces sp. ACT-1]MYR51328.1 GNAT family N-acetyltransferase [Streptomyces sp. SID4928]MYT81466.1 GNAT family N-acetyltransferase [Streptomyces sp. SID8364]SBV07146.1 Acetyltransferases [Streptomyces sp. MnatMP-M77]
MHSPSPLSLVELPVRRLNRGDLVSCADLCEDRGWPRDEHRWGLLLSAGTGYGVDAPDGKGLAATCLTMPYGSDLTAVGMLLVADRYGRRGLARRLMRHVMETVGEVPLVLYATELGRPLYEDLGFSPVGRAERVGGRFGAGAAPDSPSASRPSLTTRPATADDLQAMIRLDLPVFGADRTHLLARLPAFSDRLQVAEEHGELTGYAALWPSGQAQIVGPLIARDTATAQALVTALAATTDRPLRTEVHAAHNELLGWLTERGLEPLNRTTVMTYNLDGLPGDATRRFSPLTLATG